MSHEPGGVLHLTFLIYKSEDNPKRYTVHCLELDVVAVESNRPRAIILLKELITDLLNTASADGTLDQIFTPAPSKYWKVLAHAKPYDPSEKVRRHRIKGMPVYGVNYAWAGAC